MDLGPGRRHGVTSAQLNKFNEEPYVGFWVTLTLTYTRDRMVSLNILPLSLNLQIYDLIAFLKLVKDDSIFHWYNHVQRCTSQHTTRNISSLMFKLPAIRKFRDNTSGTGLLAYTTS